MNQKELESYIYAYGKDLYSFCCSVAYDRQEADDLYQDTFLKLYEMGESLEIKKNPKSFLMSISVNLYRNAKRKFSIHRRIMGTAMSVEEAADIPSGEKMTEDEVMEKEECRMVRSAVGKLPDKYRIPVLLFYMEELSISDISSILKLPEGTVKSRIHRAKKILKQKLEDQAYEK